MTIRRTATLISFLFAIVALTRAALHQASPSCATLASIAQ